ncbi:MAG: pyridoxamine 5'-phosphate oxidase family protein [Actinomycetota bacterium]
MATADEIIKLRELIGDTDVVMVTTGTPSGELHSRPLTLGSIEDDGTLTFLVDRRADWVAGVQFGQATNIALANDDDKVWISIAGHARIGEDRATIDRLWSPAVETFFDGGVDSPDLRVLFVEPTIAEYWDAPSGPVQRLLTLASSLLGRSTPDSSGSIELG